MHIVTTPRAPNPRRVRIFLAEKGIVVPSEAHDMMSGGLQSDEIRRLNPWMRAPILVLDDGRAISESVAICRYFEELHPNPPLFGTGALERAEVEMWNRRIELGLFNHIAQVFRHLNQKMAPLEVPQVVSWGEANAPKVERELQLLEERLATSRYFVGDSFTIADITALVAIDFMKPARLVIGDQFANILDWHRRVSMRPSVVGSLV